MKIVSDFVLRALDFNCVSEKIRRINKEPIRSRVNFSKKTGIVFLVAAGISFLSAASYLSVGYLKDRKNSPTGSVSGGALNETSDKNVAAAICRGEECFWLNKGGFAFGKSGKSAGNLVLNIKDKTSRELKIGERLLKPETLAELLFLRKRISEDLGVPLKESGTSDSNLSDFYFAAAEGWTLKFTLAENAYKTLEILKQTLEEIKKTALNGLAGLEYIDLRIPNKVFYKFTP